LKELELRGFDRLHFLHCGKDLMEALCEDKLAGFRKTEFTTHLANEYKRSGIGNLSTSDWRSLFINAERSLLPFIQTPLAKNFFRFAAHLLVELAYLLYVAELTPAQRARFVVVAFIFCRLVMKRYPALANSLYLHYLLTHISDRIATDAAFDPTTEGCDRFEQFFARMKHFWASLSQT
jgi:hypothetical protein